MEKKEGGGEGLALKQAREIIKVGGREGRKVRERGIM